jgi:hypothetical protein
MHNLRKRDPMRVACDISTNELQGDYGWVGGVCATCSRCGHETENYGTSDASIRRCLALLREECPNDEHNYYLDASDEPRRSPTAAYERGYADGHAAATRERRADGRGQFNAAQLRALVTLCHPDRHPAERAQLANRATARATRAARTGTGGSVTGKPLINACCRTAAGLTDEDLLAIFPGATIETGGDAS